MRFNFDLTLQRKLQICVLIGFIMEINDTSTQINNSVSIRRIEIGTLFVTMLLWHFIIV